MFAWLKAAAGRVFKTKVGIALVGALVVGGGGTAMAMAGAQAPLLSHLVVPGAAASPTAHSDDSSTATTVAGHDDEDGNAAGCTGASGASGAAASPTAHDGDSSTATTVAGKGDQDASEHEGTAGDQDEAECAGSVASVNVAGMSFALSTARGSITIHVDGNTRFAGGVSGLSGLQVGARVRVDGNLQTGGTVLARYVEVHKAEPTRTPGTDDGSGATHTPEATQGPGGD